MRRGSRATVALATIITVLLALVGTVATSMVNAVFANARTLLPNSIASVTCGKTDSIGMGSGCVARCWAEAA